MEKKKIHKIEQAWLRDRKCIILSVYFNTDSREVTKYQKVYSVRRPLKSICQHITIFA